MLRASVRRQYTPVAVETAIDDLVERLCIAEVANKVDKRLSVFEQLKKQHQEKRKNAIKTAVGMAAITLSLSPGAVNTARICHRHEHSWFDCGQQVAAFFGTLMVFGVSVWGFWDIYMHPIRFREFVSDMNDEFDRLMQRKHGAAPVERVFELINALPPRQLKEFKKRLHARTSMPSASVLAAQAGAEGGRAEARNLSPRASGDDAQQFSFEQYFDE